MKQNEIEISEELVEDTKTIIAKCIKQIGDFCQDDESLARLDEVLDYWSKYFIARIGQAYAEGLPLPGEVGRWPMTDETESAFFERRTGEKSDFLLIALSPRIPRDTERRSPPMNQNEMDINSSLIREIRLLFCEDCSEGPQRYEYQASLDDPICEVGAEKECNERAKKVIIRISQAFLRGDLDEALGVVGRYPHTLLHRNRKMTRIESDLFDHYKAHRDEIESFIALGREEEK